MLPSWMQDLEEMSSCAHARNDEGDSLYMLGQLPDPEPIQEPPGSRSCDLDGLPLESTPDARPSWTIRKACREETSSAKGRLPSSPNTLRGTAMAGPPAITGHEVSAAWNGGSRNESPERPGAMVPR